MSCLIQWLAHQNTNLQGSLNEQVLANWAGTIAEFSETNNERRKKTETQRKGKNVEKTRKMKKKGKKRKTGVISELSVGPEQKCFLAFFNQKN